MSTANKTGFHQLNSLKMSMPYDLKNYLSAFSTMVPNTTSKNKNNKIESQHYLNLNYSTNNSSKKVFCKSIKPSSGSKAGVTKQLFSNFSTQRNYSTTNTTRTNATNATTNSSRLSVKRKNNIRNKSEGVSINNLNRINKSKLEDLSMSLHNDKHFKDIIKEKDEEIQKLKDELTYLKLIQGEAKPMRKNEKFDKNNLFQVSQRSKESQNNQPLFYPKPNSFLKGFNTMTNGSFSQRINYLSPNHNNFVGGSKGSSFISTFHKKASQISFEEKKNCLTIQRATTQNEPKNESITSETIKDIVDYKSKFEELKERMRKVLENYMNLKR